MYWYETAGKDTDVFVSTRVRLARNLVDYPFEPRLVDAGAKEILAKVSSALSENAGYTFTDLSALDRNQRLSLVEKHLISPEMVEKKSPCAIVENTKNQVHVLLCEEDHIRIQAIRPGFDPEGAFTAAVQTDELLDSALQIAFDEKLGYLTHCPTNLGTGMRVSVMMFLPALTMTGRIKSIQGQLQKIGLTVRGITGEGSAAKGCLYQFSNCVTAGITEEEILENLKGATGSIAQSERDTRKQLLQKNEDALRDRVMRALGTLQSAYIMGSEELFRLYADVRLGVSLEICTGLTTTNLDTLLIRCMPATLTLEAEGPVSAAERDKLRAKKLRDATKNQS